MGAAKRRWTTEELGYLLENAGRVPIGDLCEAMGRPRETLEAVAARVRECGYPISLTTATCPMCGRSAPLDWKTGICKPCLHVAWHAEVQRQISEILPFLSAEDRAVYENSEAGVGQPRVCEQMPKPPVLSRDASEADRMRAEDAYCLELVEWETRRSYRILRAAQKRKERIRRKAIANDPEGMAAYDRSLRGNPLPLTDAGTCALGAHISPKEYAEATGKSITTVYRRLKAGMVTGATKVDNRWRIPAAALAIA
ncbi:MAG: hypothetical protein IKG22_04040 [Atopobiaceae bacterium]|nr:hypothetical protein [Atopobiaceae bacterium]